MKNPILILAITFFFIQCQQKEVSTHQDAHLGHVVFDVTGAEEALPLFHEGLLLLHSFEFDDAAEKFVEAQKIDSNFVMAYWGEAMSFNHPLWNERFTDDGTNALEKLADTPEERMLMAQTELEKEFLSGVEILYSEGEKEDLDDAYKEHMEKLYKKYPEHNEVAAFYALSLLGASEGREKDDHYGLGAKIAQSIIEENPDHPGALHYLIHSYDDPDHASLALNAANRYSEVAPDAEHALHMPSHIFIALGMWDEVISSNIASYEASLARMKAKDLDNDARGYHAFKWLMYGYLQKGEFEKAKEMVYEMKQYCDEKPSSRARDHFIMMKADYLTESGDWSDSIVGEYVDTDKLGLLVKGVQVFTKGMAGYEKNDLESLTGAIDELSSMQSDAETKMVLGEPKMCSGVSRYQQPPSKNAVNRLKVLKYELEALSSLLNEDIASTENWLKMAIETEEETKYIFGPPRIVKPSFEMYGEWLLTQGRNQEAQVQFEKVLERAPKRRIALEGLEKATT